MLGSKPFKLNGFRCDVVCKSLLSVRWETNFKFMNYLNLRCGILANHCTRPGKDTIMNSIKAATRTLFTRHLFITNVASCGGLLFLGDGIVQTIERTYARKERGQIVQHDFERSGRMFLIGLMLGPFNHFWYKMLDKYVTGTGVKMVMKKVAADQTVAGPFFCTTFIMASGLLERKPLKDCIAEWKAKFLTIYFADWCVWPPAQIINFYFLPPQFRVIYVSMITLCWNSFLSYMKHKDIHRTKLAVVENDDHES